MTGAPKPLANGQYDVAAWPEFVRSKGLKGGGEPVGNQEALKARKLLAEIEEKELRLAIRRGDYVPIDKVRVEWTTQVGRAIAILRTKLESELPPILQGKDAISIQKECAAAIDDVCQALHEDR